MFSETKGDFCCCNLVKDHINYWHPVHYGQYVMKLLTVIINYILHGKVFNIIWFNLISTWHWKDLENATGVFLQALQTKATRHGGARSLMVKKIHSPEPAMQSTPTSIFMHDIHRARSSAANHTALNSAPVLFPAHWFSILTYNRLGQCGGQVITQIFITSFAPSHMLLP